MNIIERYKHYLVNNQQRSENTTRAYLSDISSFVTSFPNFKELQKKDIVEYLSTLNGKFSAPTIMRKTASIQSFYCFLVNIGELDKNVTEALPRPKLRDKVVECPSKEEVLEMIEKAKDDTLKVAIELGAFVGLRASEAIALRLENINFKTGVATLFDTKTASTAQVAMGKVTLDSIEKYCNRMGITSGEVLRNNKGNPFNERAFSRMIESNLPNNYHKLRASCATELANSPTAGLHSAMAQLRHSNVRTTMFYIKTDYKHQGNVLDKMRG